MPRKWDGGSVTLLDWAQQNDIDRDWVNMANVVGLDGVKLWMTCETRHP